MSLGNETKYFDELKRVETNKPNSDSDSDKFEESQENFPKNNITVRKKNSQTKSTSSISNWSLDTKMALMEIRDILKLIPEYNGKEKQLDPFVKKN